MSLTVSGLKQTKKEAQSLLRAEEIAAELENKNRILEIEKTGLEAQVAKTHELEKTLSLKYKFGYQTIAAAVIGRSVDSWHYQFIINKGSNEYH